MAGSVLNQPFEVVITPNSWFHLGWLEAVLGSERYEFDAPDILVPDSDCDSYNEGYDMGMSCKSDLTQTFISMRHQGQLTVCVQKPTQEQNETA